MSIDDTLENGLLLEELNILYFFCLSIEKINK